MQTRTWILWMIALMMPLSGCISAKDDVDGQGNSDDGTEGGPEIPDIPHPIVTAVYSDSWTGSQTLGNDFTVPDGHDALFATFGHTGQMMGHPRLEVGGEAMDRSRGSQANGAFDMKRTLPADPGTARVRLDGYLNGAGSLQVHAIANLTPPVLLDIGWSGQRTDLVLVDDTTIHFYVPEGVQRLKAEITGSGQTLLGMRILDPDGDAVASLGPGNGPQEQSQEAEAKAGLWSLELQGSTNGSWNVLVVPVDPAPGDLDA